MPTLGFDYAEGPRSFIASETIEKGRGVKFGSTVMGCDQNDTSGEYSYGIALEKKLVGETVSVLRRGRFDKAIAGAALATLHTELMVTATGKYVAATTGLVIVGWNLTTAAGDASEFVIELDTSGRLKA